MSVVHVIDTVTEWARVNICDHIKLKQPPEDLNAPNDAGYDYKLVNPASFPMYVPTSDKLPPGIHVPFPSLCVRFLNGEDHIRDGFVDLQFCFSTWDTGLHGEDILNPGDEIGSFKWWSGEKADNFFKRSAGGWRDAWNFVDIALRAVESTADIGGYTVDRTTPVKFGPLVEQESITDQYPFWFAWVSFRVKYPLRRNNEELEKFL